MKNWVESFGDNAPSDLELQINRYCQKYNCEPVSISVLERFGLFYALVVMREGEEGGEG